MLNVAQLHQRNWTQNEGLSIKTFIDNKVSIVPNLLLDDTFKFLIGDITDILKKKLGDTFYTATNIESVNVNNFDLPKAIQSPQRLRQNGEWLKGVNIVSINVAKVGSFWDVLKYTLTLPKTHQAIHLNSIFEVFSKNNSFGYTESWRIDTKFYSMELNRLIPHLDTVEKQLKAVVNLLHALGKTVGIDMTTYVNVHSEMVLSNPHLFEWVQRGNKISKGKDLQERVKDSIIQFLKQYCPAYPLATFPEDKEVFFSDIYGEQRRNEILFGKPNQVKIRHRRIMDLSNFLLKQGYELLEISKIDAVEPLKKSVSLSQYKLYQGNTEQRGLSSYHLKKETCDYITKHYQQIQQNYAFDFMKVSISHTTSTLKTDRNQIRLFNDFAKVVKKDIQSAGNQHFAVFTDNYYTDNPPNYLNETVYDVIINETKIVVSKADNSQKNKKSDEVIKKQNSVNSLKISVSNIRRKPNTESAELRLFKGIFITDVPSYTYYDEQSSRIAANSFQQGFGNFMSKTNEYFINQYIKTTKKSPEDNALDIQRYANKIWETIEGKAVQWLIPPTSKTGNGIIAWTQKDRPTHIFIANTNKNALCIDVHIPNIKGLKNQQLRLDFSNYDFTNTEEIPINYDSLHYDIGRLFKDECRVYTVNKY